MIKAVKAGDWSLVDGRPVAAGVTLEEGEYELRLVAGRRRALGAAARAARAWSCSTPRSRPELAAEGLARDVIRVVQQARREADLDVSDRITLVVEASARGRRGGRGAPGLRRGGDAGHVGAARCGRRVRRSPARSARARRYEWPCPASRRSRNGTFVRIRASRGAVLLTETVNTS